MPPKKKTKTLIELVTEILNEHKAIDLDVFEIHHLTDIADHMVIATGTSAPHLKAMARKLIEGAKKSGFAPLGREGDTASGWVLIDLGDVIVNLMLSEMRNFYNLEELWKKSIPEILREEVAPKRKALKTKTALSKKTVSKTDKKTAKKMPSNSKKV